MNADAIAKATTFDTVITALMAALQGGRKDANAPQLPGPAGKTMEVRTAKGTKLDTQFTVLEAADLIASHTLDGRENPAFPQELQPRDRTRKSSQLWITKTANDLDPGLLGRTKKADSGAPIIGPDRIVESGNGRTLAILEAYRLGKANEYREWLIEDAESYGLDPAHIASMKAPVLVRVRLGNVDRKVFAVEANQDDKLAMTATEKAAVDANRLTPALLEKFSPGEDGDLMVASNREFIMGFLRDLGEAEAAQYLTSTGDFTGSLIARLQAAIFHKAYEDERLLELMADTAKPENRNVLNALNASASEFIRARSINEAQTQRAAEDLSEAVEMSLDDASVKALIDATNIVRAAKRENMAVDLYVGQLGMFGDHDPAVAALAVFIAQNNRSSKRLAVAFKAIAEYVRREVERGQIADIFGEATKVSLVDLVNAANRKLEEVYGTDNHKISGEFVLEAAQEGNDAIVAEIAAAKTFSQVVQALLRFGELIGEDADRAADVIARGQFGLRRRGQKARKELNAKAREIIARVQGDAAKLTDEDRDVLSQYSGRGGIADDNSLSEYYTPTPIAEGVWDMLKENGFANGNVLEPSTGSGVFAATKPAGTKISGAEIDETSSGVAKLLFPVDDIHQQSFEQLCATTPDNSFDSVIGNVPFGDTRGQWAQYDKEYQYIKEMERYFVTRAIDKCKPGGLIALIVPPNIVGKKSKPFNAWRRDISRKAEFLGAHKLPSGTFGGANGNGTDTVVDVLLMRKHSAEVAAKIEDMAPFPLEQANVFWKPFIEGKWFETPEGKRFVHGEIVEGFRTTVKANIDNASLKKQLARKFSSRIDFAALETAETITRNYSEGDRRSIGGMTHELINGEWVKVHAADGIGADDSLDANRYGVDSKAQLLSLLQGSALDALALRYAQAAEAVNGAFARDAGPMIQHAVHAASQASDSHKERVYRAALIGQAISLYGRSVQTDGHDTAKLEQLQRLVVNEHEQYGSAAKDPALRKLTGPGAAGVGAFVRAMHPNGGFSELLAGVKDGTRGQAYDAQDPADIVRFLSLNRGTSATLEDVQNLYTGKEPLSIETLAAHDQIAIDPHGNLHTMQRYTSGHVVQKIVELRMAMSGDIAPALQDKYRAQIAEINRRRKYVEVDDINFGMRDKWIDREKVRKFLASRGYHFAYGEYEFKGEMTEGYHVSKYTKPGQFETQLLNYLNNRPVRSADKASAAGYKRQIADMEETFNAWLRQQDDIEEMVDQYNDIFNNYVPVEYDGEDLPLDNVADWVKPHDYQASGVRRLSDEGKGVLAFDVGLGKTLSALALVQYNTQKGRAKRTCITVPKAVLENWYHETRQFHISMDHVHFVGFTPKRGKGGEIERTPVLDAEGNPKTNAQGETQYRDVLVEDNDKTIWEKMHDIPQTAKSLVIMSRERFGMIPLRQETFEAYSGNLIMRNLTSAKNIESASAKRGYQAAKQREKIKEKFSDKGTSKKDEYPSFEDMGFDSVIVDEAHEFKNAYEAGKDSQRLAYLPTPPASDRALDLAAKMDYLRKHNNDNGPVLLTATPVTNSPVEIYNMLSHVVPPDFFDGMGIKNVDDFVRTFCHIEVVQRTKLSGETSLEDGVSGFKNLSGLRTIFHRFVNLKTAKDVGENVLKLPDSQEIHDEVELTQEQNELYQNLREEAASIGQEGARPVFAIIRDMDRVTTDLDLYRHTMTFTFRAADRAKVADLIADLPITFKMRFTDEDTGEKVEVEMSLAQSLNVSIDGDTLRVVVPESYESEVVKRLKKVGIDPATVAHPVMPKYAKLLENLRRDYENGGKQIVFTEEKTQHDKLKRIITHHLPIQADEVGIINADTASGDKLEKTAAAFNSGTIRIVIANKKAEVGVNLQKGTTAIHHLTLPWTPASIQQRNGRGVRQGNTAANVAVHYYLGKGSFDAYRLEVLERKADWINDLFFGYASEARNADANSDEEMALMLASDPEERSRMIAEFKARESAKERAYANKRAGIDMANLVRHRATIAELEKETALSEHQKERLTKARQQVEQLTARLRSEHAKGRIDFDADALLRGDVPYVITPKGVVVLKGMFFKKKNTDEIYFLTTFSRDQSVVYLSPFDRYVGDATIRVSDMDVTYEPTTVDIDQVFEKVVLDALTYEKLRIIPIDEAYLRSKTQEIQKAPFWQDGGLIANAQGELKLYFSDEGEPWPEGYHVSKPNPENEAWRERALRLLASTLQQESKPLPIAKKIKSLAVSLFGFDWHKQAIQYSDNLIPESVIMEILASMGALLLTTAQIKCDEALAKYTQYLDPKNKQEETEKDAAMNALTGVPSSGYSLFIWNESTWKQKLNNSGYDFDLDVVTKKFAHPYFNNDLHPKMYEIFTRAKDAMLALEAARKAEQDKSKAESDALITAELAKSIPAHVLDHLNQIGIQCALNTALLTWKDYKTKRPMEADPGTYLTLFDPKGYGGPLSKAFQGNNALKARLNAVWYKHSSQWIMPVHDLDFDTLLKAFD